VVTEFSDYRCPACTSVARGVIPELIKQYVDTGKVRYVYREFPIASHPFSQNASEAAICAGKQDKYWEMNEKLFASQEEWSAADPASTFPAYAQELGLDVAAFNECLDSGEAATVVQGDLLAGEAAGVNATPYFFINDLPIRGGLPIEALGRVIDYVAAGGPEPTIVPPPGDWHLRGDPQTAKAVTVAFVDYASPESSQHALQVLPELVKTYIDSGKLIYVLHPWSASDDSPSARAAIAAECAGEQDRYWEMHDQLFAEQAAWTKASNLGPLFSGYADSEGLDVEQFKECLDSDGAKLRVEAGNVLGALYGVPGAPVFLFNDGSAKEGSPPLEEFKTTIDGILNR